MKEINIRDLKENFVKLFAEDWALLSAKSEDGCNPMTVSWGSIGELWAKDTATVYVRQSRFTKELIDNEKYFSLCFFDKKYKDVLSFCGSTSGRDVDKIAKTNLTPIYTENAPYYKEARIAIICKKRASTFLGEDSFVDKTIKGNFYSDNDMHTIYFGEIEKVLISE